MEHIDLLALADFNLVSRHGGFGRAARAAARPKATLSRRVSELESSLGLRLFERGGRSLKLTQEGSLLFERTAPLLSQLDEAATMIASGGDKPKGRLRVSAPLLFSQVAMGKLAAAFTREYPDVRLEVTTEDRAVDVVEDGYDVVIRVNPKPDASLVGRILVRDRLVVVASPSLQRPAKKQSVPAVVRGQTEGTVAWNVTMGKKKSRLLAHPVLSLSSLFMVRDAVRGGAGAACLPVSLVSHDLAVGKLVHWGEIEDAEIALWLLHPSRRLLSARVSALLEFMKRAFPRGTAEELAAYVKETA